MTGGTEGPAGSRNVAHGICRRRNGERRAALIVESQDTCAAAPARARVRHGFEPPRARGPRAGYLRAAPACKVRGMSPELIETDYLIVGAGAMGMAFADTLLTESNADIVIVDRLQRPGGHWNHAYPFVRLHLASTFYGVASRPLGEDKVIAHGVNAGSYELASAAEICSYFERVMNDTLLPSGRVRYFPMSDYKGLVEGEHRLASLLTGKPQRVRVRKKLVDATYTDTCVPSTHPPGFAVAEGVRCVPINALSTLTVPPGRYVVVGAGKTAIDACLWLLEQGVEPASIRWIKPREAWMQDRAHVQPKERSIGILSSFADAMEAAAGAESIDHLFERLSAARVLVRVDERVKPTMYHCATVSAGELAQLRTIGDVVRLGRVKRIEPDRIELEQGSVAARPDDLYVHCSSKGIHRRAPQPVFTDERITLQAVRWCAPAFSAALIAHLEATREGTAMKNAFSAPLPYPDSDRDWIPVFLGNMIHEFVCRSDAELRAWTARCRMNPASSVAAYCKPQEEPWRSQLDRMKQLGPAALEKLQRFSSQLE